ncbi:MULTISPECIES: Fic family protein [Thiomicrorhabdus]|uniref:Fic family protein n=1 Tax=Thiomicrorhabdus heinhorstiae TaxID=2748010 RepID=A0ABS0BV72_9GAMM|nr:MULTISPECIES: Fic family protein [Thiomicrorhabdus]MBF6057723.1 Fic family protein [Thiomicrorhabdus heinhorstiae]
MKLPVNPPDNQSLLDELVKRGDIAGLSKLMNAETGICDEKGRYLHWDKLRFVAPPYDLSSEEYWFVTKQARRQFYRSVSLVDKQGSPMQFCLTDSLLQSLHWLDQHAAGQLSMPQPIANQHTRDAYLVSSLIEEAINSSQLEGASTTRDVARSMLKQKRAPQDISEQMIVNNYRAMQEIRDLKDEALTPQLICHLHSVLTDRTLERADKAGKLRSTEDLVRVVDNRDAQVLHVPPDAESLPERIQCLCDFANHDGEKAFIHPVIKAMILHFMIGYEHPFVDGNGRTARALFYWYMAKCGYWLIEFVSISKIIKLAPAQYSKAFLLTESDDNDLTYFLIHQTEVLQKSIDELFAYLQRKSEELIQTEQFLKGSKLQGQLNHRQLDVLRSGLKGNGTFITIEGHRSQHAISYQTARTDLLGLADKYQLLEKHKQGKGFIFVIPVDLNERIESLN